MNLLSLVALLCSTTSVLATTGLKFDAEKLPYAEYKPWDLSTNGTVELFFKTDKQNALLLYQDDGDGKDWIDVFLVGTRARLRLTLGTCYRKTKFLNGSFSDSKWHRLNIKRNFSTTTFSIDGIKSSPIACKILRESPGKPKPHRTSLFLGGIPLMVSHGRWSNPTIFIEVPHHLFSGCIARVQYSGGENTLRKAKYKKSSGTTADCQGACVEQCKNGGKCIDMLVSARCDCGETGYKGEHCEESLLTDDEPNNITTGMYAAHGRGLAPSMQPLPLIATMIALTCGMLLGTESYHALLCLLSV